MATGRAPPRKSRTHQRLQHGWPPTTYPVKLIPREISIYLDGQHVGTTDKGPGKPGGTGAEVHALPRGGRGGNGGPMGKCGLGLCERVPPRHEPWFAQGQATHHRRRPPGPTGNCPTESQPPAPARPITRPASILQVGEGSGNLAHGLTVPLSPRSPAGLLGGGVEALHVPQQQGEDGDDDYGHDKVADRAQAHLPRRPEARQQQGPAHSPQGPPQSSPPS